jgi:hypothetical protein
MRGAGAWGDSSLSLTARGLSLHAPPRAAGPFADLVRACLG